MKSVLVSGANGFIGKHFCGIMSARGYHITASTRKGDRANFENAVKVVSSGDIGPHTDWLPALKGVDVIVHLAARAHIFADKAKRPIDEYRRLNVEGTRRIAESAAQAGIERFIYVSSIKVNGEFTEKSPFREDDTPDPQDPYAVSKWEAELMLRCLSEQSAMEIVIIRPPLVYGPGVKGNLLRLMQCIDREYPLPLAGVDNRRSMISLDNLIDILELLVRKKTCAGKLFLVSDMESVSTTELVLTIAAAMDRNAHLFSVPPFLTKAASGLFPSVKTAIDKLFGSLVVDNSRARSMLKWEPRQQFIDGIQAMVDEYLKSSKYAC